MCIKLALSLSHGSFNNSVQFESRSDKDAANKVFHCYVTNIVLLTISEIMGNLSMHMQNATRCLFYKLKLQKNYGNHMHN